jgi:hypothetical protein
MAIFLGGAVVLIGVDLLGDQPMLEATPSQKSGIDCLRLGQTRDIVSFGRSQFAQVSLLGADLVQATLADHVRHVSSPSIPQ